MARLFISYTRNDFDHAAKLAAALKAKAHEVWWDEDLRAAEDFRERIADRVKWANAVIVVWSKASVGRPWVVSEANLAFTERKLIPVKFEERTPDLPMPMNSMNVADLQNWSGSPDDPSYLALEEIIFKVAHNRFAETILNFGGRQFEHTIGRSEAAKAVFELGSSIFFIPTHRFIRGAVLCGIGVSAIAFFVEHLVVEDSEALPEVAIQGMVYVSIARLCLQVVNLSKGVREMRFFDRSFSYWLPIFFMVGAMYYIYRMFDPDYENRLGDSITIAAGGLALFYFVRSLLAGYQILVERTKPGR